MPDTRTRRGPHPKDPDCFADRELPRLRVAVDDLSWLLSRGYSTRVALKLVGDHHSLRDRQRKALQRCAAGEESCRRRRRSRVAVRDLRGETLAVDGYNVLLTLEAALSDGVLLLARDGCLRDLAALSRHYRRLETTRPAVELLIAFLSRAGCRKVLWHLDRPVSNSGRLGRLIEEITADSEPAWEVMLTDQVDRVLIESPHIVATADSAILDRCGRWLNLARLAVEEQVPDAWILDLRSAVE